jgi:DNA-3-methyladenine glycosylase
VSRPLPRAFFRRDPVTCARELVGVWLDWEGRGGVIVETEAYAAEGDPACHTWTRPSARAFVAGHDAGAAYVYFNYGVHWMLNVLVKGPNPGFVLLRALDPRAGLAEMHAARGTDRVTALCSGPGKLARALGVTGADHGRDLCAPGGPRRSPRRVPRGSASAGRSTCHGGSLPRTIRTSAARAEDAGGSKVQGPRSKVQGPRSRVQKPMTKNQ